MASADETFFYDIKREIKRKINNTRNEFYGTTYAEQHKDVSELVRRSVEGMESNIAILWGPAGCGKTILVKNAINELKENGVINDENSFVIWLNGLVHTDDRISLLDISRQLKMGDFSEQSISSKSFQENLAFLMEQLQRNNTQKPCVIFILDEFHLFTEHKNQLLLYNLFDTAQSAKSPICVLGMTYYSDVKDLLEKRVLSRFSHRFIHMTNVVTVEDRLETLKNVLTINENVHPKFALTWNTRTEELLKSPAVRRALDQSLIWDCSEARYRTLLFHLISSITYQTPFITESNFTNVFTLSDEYIRIISRLSALEVALLVAIKHYSTNYEREPFNFEMILTQYLKFVKQHASTMVTVRAVILKAFQRLQELELILAVKKGTGNVAGKIPLEFQLYTFNLTDEQVREGVKINRGVSADLLQWAEDVAS